MLDMFKTKEPNANDLMVQIEDERNVEIVIEQSAEVGLARLAKHTLNGKATPSVIKKLFIQALEVNEKTAPLAQEIKEIYGATMTDIFGVLLNKDGIFKTADDFAKTATAKVTTNKTSLSELHATAIKEVVENDFSEEEFMQRAKKVSEKCTFTNLDKEAEEEDKLFALHKLSETFVDMMKSDRAIRAEFEGKNPFSWTADMLENPHEIEIKKAYVPAVKPKQGLMDRMASLLPSGIRHALAEKKAKKEKYEQKILKNGKRSAFIAYAERGNIERMKAFLDEDINDEYRLIALSDIAILRNIDGASLLLESGIDKSKASVAIAEAIRRTMHNVSLLEITNLLLAYDVSVLNREWNFNEILEKKNGLKTMEAITNAASNQERTEKLYEAIEQNDIAGAAELLKEKICFLYEGIAGKTVLEVAKEFNRNEIAYLIEYKMEKEATQELLTCAKSGDEHLALVAMRKLPDVNAQDCEGNTPLAIAARYGFVKIAQILLDKNADTTIKNKNGDTAENRANFYGHKKIAYMIKHHERQQPLLSRKDMAKVAIAQNKVNAIGA